MADVTIEQLTAERDAALARLALAERERDGSQTEVTTHKTAAEKAAAEAQAARDEVKAAREAAEGKVTQIQTEAQAKLTKAALRVAATAAGAKDFADVLALVDQSKVKLDANGELENGDALIAELKTAKPYLFGSGRSTHAAELPPNKKDGTGQKSALEMTPEELKAAKAAILKGK